MRQSCQSNTRHFPSLSFPPSSFLGELVVHPGRDTTKCLTAASNTDGAQVTIDTCTGAAAQKWTFGDAQRVKIFGDKCLNVVDGSTADGTKLQIWTCSTNGDVNEKFWFSYVSAELMSTVPFSPGYLVLVERIV